MSPAYLAITHRIHSLWLDERMAAKEILDDIARLPLTERCAAYRYFCQHSLEFMDD